MTEHEEIVMLFRRYLEHLSGKHNQKSHGNRFGSDAAIRANVKRLGKDKEALKRMAKRARKEQKDSGVPYKKDEDWMTSTDRIIALRKKKEQAIKAKKAKAQQAEQEKQRKVKEKAAQVEKERKQKLIAKPGVKKAPKAREGEFEISYYEKGQTKKRKASGIVQGSLALHNVGRGKYEIVHTPSGLSSYLPIRGAKAKAKQVLTKLNTTDIDWKNLDINDRQQMSRAIATIDAAQAGKL